MRKEPIAKVDQEKTKRLDDLIETLRKKLCPKDTYVSWSGVAYDTENKFVRADKTCLNVLMFEDDQWIFRRCPNVIDYDAQGRKVVWVVNAPVCRIKTGTRSGCVIRAADLHAHEQGVMAGLSKRLATSKEKCGNAISINDRQAVSVLYSLNLFPGWNHRTMEELLPEIYLTLPAHRVPTMRVTAEAHKLLSTVPGRNMEGKLEELRRRASNCSEEPYSELEPVPCGKNRLGWTFRHFDGRGVLAVHPFSMDSRMRFGEWSVLKGPLTCMLQEKGVSDQ